MRLLALFLEAPAEITFDGNRWTRGLRDKFSALNDVGLNFIAKEELLDSAHGDDHLKVVHEEPGHCNHWVFHLVE